MKNKSTIQRYDATSNVSYHFSQTTDHTDNILIITDHTDHSIHCQLGIR